MKDMAIATGSLACDDPEKAQKDMSLACNTFTLDIDGFMEQVREDRILAKKWESICWYWVESLARRYDDKDYDGRNKQSCYIGSLLQRAIDDKYKPLPELPRTDFTKAYIAWMAYDHRTLQQTFTRLVFLWLRYLADEKGNRKAIRAVRYAISKVGDRWYSLPMI